jgi:hypothetical protein
MKKILEDYLWNEISYAVDEKDGTEFHRFPCDVINEMVEKGWINNPKQAYRTLEKWSGKGIYNYGSSIGCGWKARPD